jgi:hypothetical protein
MGNANVLLVAGRPFDAIVESEIRAAADGAAASRADDVRLDLRWIPPDEVQPFFAAADLVVLPYRQILNSGAVVLAMTLGRPVLVPDLGSMRELQETFGAAWVRLFAGDLTAGELTAASAWARSTQRPPIDPASLDWRPRALQIKRVYEELVQGRRPEPALGQRARSDEIAT